MSDKIIRIHERALSIAATHRRSEADLVSIIQEIEADRVYLHFGANSVYDYASRILGLSEATSYNLITVARRAREVPALKEAVESGAITVSKARKIAPVLTQANQDAWLELAATKSSREIEREVAKADPQPVKPERFDYVTEEFVRARLDIPEALMKKLRRIQDLESQRTSTASTIVETLDALADFYIEKKAPESIEIRKAAREAKRKRKSDAKISPHEGDAGTASPVASDCESDLSNQALVQNQSQNELVTGRVGRLTAAEKRAAMARDGFQCTHDGGFGRCPSRRWLDVHHVVPLSEGGTNDSENLTTLCESHHRYTHDHLLVKAPTQEYGLTG